MSVSIPFDIPIWKMKKEVGEENTVDTATVLTGFVREKYLKHLKTLLLKNYTTCSLKQHSSRVFTEQDIEECAREVENEALRECMVVQLYQKAMSSMVKDIKTSTNLLKLHNSLENFTSSSFEKETQTVPIAVEKTQPLPDLIGRFEQMKSVQSRNIMESPITHLAIKQEPYLEDTGFNSSDSSVTQSATDKRTSHCPKRHLTSNPKPHACTKTKLPKFDKNPSCELNNNMTHSEPVVNESKYPSLDERLACLLQGENVVSSELIVKPETHIEPAPDLKELEFPYLDERLAEICGETAESEPLARRNRIIRKVTCWHTEKETNFRMLNSLMTRFSKTKRQQVERLFYELFESRRRKRRKVTNANQIIADLTSNDLVIGKKRLGRRVVQHLMYYYQSGQISSREMFKHAASNITDDLMLKNKLPEEMEIEESIRDFLSKNPTVKK